MTLDGDDAGVYCVVNMFIIICWPCMPLFTYTQFSNKNFTYIILIMESMSEQSTNQNQTSVIADNSIINAANTTQQDILTFEDADTIQETSSRFVDTQHEDKWRLNDVRDILSRPYRAAQFKYEVTTANGSQIVVNPMNVFFNGPYKTYLEKYSTFRGTFCCQARVNSQPFQTGAFQLAYIPPGHMATARINAEDFNLVEVNGYAVVGPPSIPFVSGLPFSQVNKLPTATSSVIKVPYKWTTDVCSISNINCGVFFWQALQSLGSKIAADFAEILIYTWIEDLEVEGASASECFPFEESQITLTDLEKMVRQNPAVRESVFLQAKTSAQEATSISKVAAKVSGVAGMLSKIPFVADIAGPVSIAADMTSKVAGFFGLSKPFTQEPMTNVTIQQGFGHANVDGVFTGNKLSVNRNQEIPVHAMGYVKEDEMATAYVIQKPSIWGAFKWSIGQNHGALLMSSRVAPGLMAVPVIANGFPCQANTYLSYMSGIFKYFRGPLKIRFSVVANSFYSGRFRVVYEPRAPSSTSPSSTIIQYPMNVSEVYDIKDAAEFEFDIPWIIENDWLETVPTSTDTETQYDMGRITIWVENELRTNAQCPDSIAIWMFVEGTPDTEFCVPRSLPTVFPNTSGYSVVKRDPISLQGRFDQSIQSIGDPSVSLRPLLRRYEPVDFRFSTTSWVNPWSLPNFDQSLLNWITRMYVHQVGSIRFWCPTHTATNVIFGAGSTSTTTIPGVVTALADPLVEMPYAATDIIDFEIPYYNIYPRIAMQSLRYESADATHVNYFVSTPRTQTPNAVTVTTDINDVYRAAGDDFNCGLLTGPRITTKYVTIALETGAVPPTLTPLN